MRVALAIVPAWSIMTAPLGLASIAGAAKKAGHEVKLFDLNVRLWRKHRAPDDDPWDYGNHERWSTRKAFNSFVFPVISADLERMVEEIADWKPDVLGLSLYDTSFACGERAAMLMRSARPRTRIVFGGPGARKSRIVESDVLRMGPGGKPLVDVAVIGEGEATFMEVLGRLEKGSSFVGCMGTAYLDSDGEVVNEPDRPNIQLSSLPLPLFAGLDFSLYSERKLPVMMSRGCVAKCAFCEETRYWKKFRYREASQVFEEFRANIRDYGIRTFAMSDSLINGNFKTLKELADLIIDSGEKIRWHGYARADQRMTPELLERLARSGLEWVSYGLETGSQAVMDLMDKRTTVEIARKVIRDTHAAGIKVHLNMIVGFPNETEADFQQTLDFLRECMPYISVVNTGETLDVSTQTPMGQHPERFGIRADEQGRPYLDEHRSWVSIDGTNTRPVRRERLERLRAFVDGFGVKRFPAPDIRRAHLGGKPVRRPIAIQRNGKTGDVLHIAWMLHNLCNHRCSYCGPYHNSGTHRSLSFDQAKAFLEQVFRHYQKDIYHISFTGGEPTLWKDFARLCAYLRERGCEVGMTSNGSRKLEFWEQVKDDFNWLCLSYHPEHSQDDPFIDVVRFMADRTRLAVRLMMHAEERHWNRSIEMGEKLKRLKGAHNLLVEYVPLHTHIGPDLRPWPYSSEQRAFFKNQVFFELNDRRADLPSSEGARLRPDLWDYQVHYSDGSIEVCRPNELLAKHEANFMKWTCYAGLDMIYVDRAGDIFRGGCKEGGRVGNILEPEIRFPVAPVVCRRSFCSCGTDIQVQKYAPGVLSRIDKIPNLAHIAHDAQASGVDR